MTFILGEGQGLFNENILTFMGGLKLHQLKADILKN